MCIVTDAGTQLPPSLTDAESSFVAEALREPTFAAQSRPRALALSDPLQRELCILLLDHGEAWARDERRSAVRCPQVVYAWACELASSMSAAVYDIVRRVVPLPSVNSLAPFLAAGSTTPEHVGAIYSEVARHVKELMHAGLPSHALTGKLMCDETSALGRMMRVSGTARVTGVAELPSHTLEPAERAGGAPPAYLPRTYEQLAALVVRNVFQMALLIDTSQPGVPPRRFLLESIPCTQMSSSATARQLFSALGRTARARIRVSAIVCDPGAANRDVVRRLATLTASDAPARPPGERFRGEHSVRIAMWHPTLPGEMVYWMVDPPHAVAKQTRNDLLGSTDGLSFLVGR